jgi:hypothetical protein
MTRFRLRSAGLEQATCKAGADGSRSTAKCTRDAAFDKNRRPSSARKLDPRRRMVARLREATKGSVHTGINQFGLKGLA